MPQNTITLRNYRGGRKVISKARLLLNPVAVKFKIWCMIHRKDIKINRDAFQSFIRINDLTYNNGQFYDYKQLEKLSSEFDAFITGSDVVWDPYNHQNKNDEGYFLNFAAEGVRRIAYAPSIGVLTLPEESKKNLKELLDKFDALSIRERTGAELIHAETGISMPVVLDPTLLADPQIYSSFKAKNMNLPDKYIAVYRFGKSKHTDKKIQEIARKLKLPIIYIPARNGRKYKPRFNIGPEEFVSTIKNATLVLTDSFHCTIFSCIYHIPFLVFMRSDPKVVTSTQSRVFDLLDTYGLSDRYVAPGMSVDYQNLFEIDFTNFDETVKKLREQSMNYLVSALGEQYEGM